MPRAAPTGPLTLPQRTQDLLTSVDDRQVEQWDDPVRGRLAFRTLFSGDRTPTRELTTGLAVLPPDGWLGLHRHTASETYFVLGGTGIVRLDGDEHPVGPGTSVFIPGDAEHGVVNTGDGELRVFYTFAAHAMSDIHYRFRGETG